MGDGRADVSEAADDDDGHGGSLGQAAGHRHLASRSRLLETARTLGRRPIGTSGSMAGPFGWRPSVRCVPLQTPVSGRGAGVSTRCSLAATPEWPPSGLSPRPRALGSTPRIGSPRPRDVFQLVWSGVQRGQIMRAAASSPRIRPPVAPQRVAGYPIRSATCRRPSLAACSGRSRHLAISGADVIGLLVCRPVRTHGRRAARG